MNGGFFSRIIFAIFARARYRKRMARRARVEYPGALYHVITRGNQRQRIVCDDGMLRAFASRQSFPSLRDTAESVGPDSLPHCRSFRGSRA
jgi:hypothetical protein